MWIAYNEKGLVVGSRGFSATLGKANMKRILAILLTVPYLLCAIGCDRIPIRTVAASFVNARLCANDSEHAHTALSFSELSDDDSELDLECSRAQELLFRIERGEISGRAAQRALDRRLAAFFGLRTAASIAHVRYCSDLSDEAAKQRYEHLSNGIVMLGNLLLDAQIALSDDPALSDLYDDASVSKLKEADALCDPSLQPLTERERALIGAYDALEGMTIAYGGRAWTKEQILSDPSLSYETFSTMYRMYRHAFHEAASKIGLELIDVRNEQAKALGFASYAEYGYALYARDYSPEDAQMLTDAVIRTIVPLFTELLPAFYDASMRLTCGSYAEEQTMRRIGTAIETLLPECKEPWDYMRSHAMYTLDAGEHKMPGSFTAYFESYGAPFLFTSWDGTHEMIRTMLHEFGHYAGFYLNGIQRVRSDDPLDLAEIDSQGLELLAISQYDILYGALSDAARIYEIVIALYTIITGCMEDAFQQFVYHCDTPTADVLNAEYERLADVFGLRDMGLTGESWSEISHTFRAPMYYISYATSMLAALQLFVQSESNRTLALSSYRSILMRRIDAAFRSTLQEAGLCDPFDETTVTMLAAKLKEMCRG